jgi:hypothetical protein
MLYRSVLAANVHIDLSTLLFKSHIYNIDSNRHVCITVHTYIKGILSTKIVICSYPKLLSFSVLTFIKWRLTPSYAAKDTIFWQKKTKLSLSELLSWMTIFKSIHMAFYVNTSWACALFINNKQHVVLGQKKNCQRVEESGLWRIQRERWIEVKYLPNGTNAR